jgi:putative transposase
VSPADRKLLAQQMVAEHGLSVRRACRAAGISRVCYFYNPKPKDDSMIQCVLKRLSERFPRYGFAMLFKLIRQMKHLWNHKRVRRVYRAMGLNLKRRRKKRLPARVKQPLTVPACPNESWSADFMSDQLCCGRRFRTFNVMDDFNRQVLAVEVDTSLSSSRVVRSLDLLKHARGLPKQIRVDNGPEFTASRFAQWAQSNGVEVAYTQPGKPTQNAFIERLNGTYRREVLDCYAFENLDEVRQITEDWIQTYNTIRPHQALDGISPRAYAQQNAQGKTLLATGNN